MIVSQITSSQLPLKLPLLYKSVSVSPMTRLHSFSKGNLTLLIKLLISLSGGGVIPWREWVKFYDNWVTAFSHHLRPIFCRRRMNFHASLYNTRVLYRFAY